jgi:hypothetical protein
MGKHITVLLLFLVSITLVYSSIAAPQKVPVAEPDANSNQTTSKKAELDLPGTRLPVDFQCPSEAENDTVTSVLPSGQILVGHCDVLFLLNLDGTVTWRYSAPQVLIDFAFVPATGLIYGTAGDNFMFILEASTGEELVGNSRNGSAAYGRVIPYGKDMCLVMDNMQGYRDRLNIPIEDRVEAWRGTERVGEADLPPHAHLLIRGKKISALTGSGGSVFIKEIRLPTPDAKTYATPATTVKPHM